MDELVKKELRRYIDSEIDFMESVGATTAESVFEYGKYIIKIGIESESL